MKYKVNYLQHYDQNGTHYDQTIKAVCTQKELSDLAIHFFNTKETTREKLLFLEYIQVGKNYTNITTFQTFEKFFRLEKDKRIKQDRNTIIEIELI